MRGPSVVGRVDAERDDRHGRHGGRGAGRGTIEGGVLPGSVATVGRSVGAARRRALRPGSRSALLGRRTPGREPWCWSGSGGYVAGVAIEATSHRAKKRLRLCVTGDLDLTGRDPILDLVAGEVAAHGLNELEVDLAATRTLDADGIRTLIECVSFGHRHGFPVRVTGVTGQPARQLEKWDAGLHVNWTR